MKENAMYRIIPDGILIAPTFTAVGSVLGWFKIWIM